MKMLLRLSKVQYLAKIPFFSCETIPVLHSKSVPVLSGSSDTVSVLYVPPFFPL